MDNISYFIIYLFVFAYVLSFVQSFVYVFIPIQYCRSSSEFILCSQIYLLELFLFSPTFFSHSIFVLSFRSFTSCLLIVCVPELGGAGGVCALWRYALGSVIPNQMGHAVKASTN